MRCTRSLLLYIAIALAVAGSASAAERHVIVYLKDQPLYSVAHDLQSRASLKLSAKEKDSKAVLATAKTQPKLKRSSEVTAISSEMASILAETDKAILKICKDATASEQSEVESAVKKAGGRVKYHYSSINAVAVSLPEEAIEALKKNPLVDRVIPDARLAPALDVSIPSIHADAFWNAGYTGGVWRPGVLDTGEHTSHPGLNHGWYGQTFHITAVTDPNYGDDSSSTDDFFGHGTAVAGPLGSTDSTYLGASYGVQQMLNLKAGFRLSTGGASMYDSDMMAAVDWAISQPDVPPRVLNFSFVGDQGLEDSPLSQYWDAVVDSFGISVSTAAGNNGGSSTVHEPGIGFNSICVGAVYDMGTVDRSDDYIASYSSTGPTISGRKKPGLVAPGSTSPTMGIMLPSRLGGYGPGNGTSYASPHVGAAMVLLGDMGVFDPRAQKAILVTTAEDKGDPGWDPQYGWGYLDLSTAYTCASSGNYARDSVAPAGGDSLRYYRFVPSAGSKATIAWNRHVVYSGQNFPADVSPLNDLDLFMYQESTNTLLSSSESRIDNVEQVVAPSAVSDAVVKVAAISTAFSGVAREDFAIAGDAALSPIQGPALSIESPQFVNVIPGSDTIITVKVKNVGQLEAYGVQLAISSNGLTVTESSPQSLGSLLPGGEAVVSWTVNGVTPDVYPCQFTVSSLSYGETVSADSTTQVCVGDRLGDIKLRQDTAQAILVAKIVTASIGDETYVEEPDHSSAVKIKGAGGFSPGSVIRAEGTLSTDCSGRVVTVPSAIKLGSTTPLLPVFMLSSSIGGGQLGDYLPALPGASGANNIGMLVKLVGRVTDASDPVAFYIDDGCELGNGSAPAGIKVDSRGLVAPHQGDLVAVTGISSAYDLSGDCTREIILRSETDFQPIAVAQ